MDKKKANTIIIGAGISGLACAIYLQKAARDFLILSQNIGGRILPSDDNKVNYGAFFICSDYKHVLRYVKIKERIKLSEFCFHQNDKTYILYEPKLIRYLYQFMKVKKLLYKFKKHLHTFRKNTEISSQKKVIENDSFLYDLYEENAFNFVHKQKLQKGTEAYLSKALYSTTFSTLKEMNAFSFLQYLLPLITPIYTFTFEKEKIIHPFKDRIVREDVHNIIYKNGVYKINTNENFFYADNIVLATEINWSKKFAGIKKTNKPISTHMLHIKGIPKPSIKKKSYHLFTPPSNVQAIANLKNGTYLVYYKNYKPDVTLFFKEPTIIAHKYWNPAGTINGHTLIESIRENNMYLIGDFNVCGLEESFITGLYAANQILKSR
jgi:hypothetical protein